MSTNITREAVEGFQHVLSAFLQLLTEPCQSGGSYVNAANRWTLMGLALSLDAKNILETGYNTGLTTLALALTGAQVVGVDSTYEQPEADELARARLANFPNVRLVQEDALLFLLKEPAESYDLIFIDDCHWPTYTKYECIEIQRLLRPGGCAVFHDTFYADLWEVIDATFPRAWQRINLPSWQTDASYSGIDTMAGRDLGLGMVRKPWVHEGSAMTIAECFSVDKAADGRLRPTMEVTVKNLYGDSTLDQGEEVEDVMAMYLHLLRKRTSFVVVAASAHEPMEEAIRTWGKYCSSCASFVGERRYGHRASKG